MEYSEHYCFSHVRWVVYDFIKMNPIKMGLSPIKFCGSHVSPVQLLVSIIMVCPQE